MKKFAVLLMVTAFALACVLVMVACQGVAPEKLNSGIKGTATLGPISPVSRPGETNEKLYDGAVIIVKNASGSTEIARTTTAQDGSFSVDLPEGSYMVEGASPEGNILPYAAPFEVK